MASLLSCSPEEIYWTSGGTESINTALKGLAACAPEKTRIVTTSIEHSATLRTCEWFEEKGYEIVLIEVDDRGLINLEMLDRSLDEKTLVFSVIWATNEIGTIQEMDKILEICHGHGVLVHVDAVQAIGKINIRFDRYPIDLMTWTSHKIFGPKGIGALYVKKGIDIEALIHGGDQEKGFRSGTEHVMGIIGFAQAMTLSYQNINEKNRHLESLSQTLFDKLKTLYDVCLIGAEIGKHRLPGHLSLSFRDRDAFELSLALNRQDVYVSTGSACHSNLLELSHVIKALPHHMTYQNGMIRISFGHYQSLELVNDIIERFTLT